MVLVREEVDHLKVERLFGRGNCDFIWPMLVVTSGAATQSVHENSSTSGLIVAKEAVRLNPGEYTMRSTDEICLTFL